MLNSFPSLFLTGAVNCGILFISFSCFRLMCRMVSQDSYACSGSTHQSKLDSQYAFISFIHLLVTPYCGSVPSYVGGGSLLRCNKVLKSSRSDCGISILNGVGVSVAFAGRDIFLGVGEGKMQWIIPNPVGARNPQYITIFNTRLEVRHPGDGSPGGTLESRECEMKLKKV